MQTDIRQERDLQVVGIVADTATAVAKISEQFPRPLKKHYIPRVNYRRRMRMQRAVGTALSLMVVAMGRVQIMTVLSMPIPKNPSNISQQNAAVFEGKPQEIIRFPDNLQR
jgi:hypothetical protein